ncbi:MAG: DUF1456 family protein [Treponemataceae bacterium]
MTNNDVLRRLRFALDIPDRKVIDLFKLADYDIRKEEFDILFMKESDEGFVECDDSLVEFFLQGLIADRRGKREDAPAQAYVRRGRLSNNDILKQLRIALELRDEDIADIMKLSGVSVSKSEIGALFRKKDHANFRPCGDQFLRNFLNGLTARRRGLSAAQPS